HRDVRSFLWLEHGRRDVVYALRMLRSHWGFSLAVIVMLSLGIGANATIFSALHGLVLEQIPVRDPGTLVRLRYVGDNDMAIESMNYGPGERATFSYPIIEQFRAANQTLTDFSASAPYPPVDLLVNGVPDVATAFVASGNYFGMLGVTASLGR